MLNNTIDQELWEKVKERQGAIVKKTRPDAQEGTNSFWERHRPKHLLTGIMKCGACGASYVKISATHFGCAAARSKGEAICHNMPTIRRDVLEATGFDGLRIMDPELFKIFEAEVNRIRMEGRAD